jgi:hypothetical protein
VPSPPLRVDSRWLRGKVEIAFVFETLVRFEMMDFIMFLINTASGKSVGRGAHHTSNVKSTTQLDFVYRL